MTTAQLCLLNSMLFLATAFRDFPLACLGLTFLWSVAAVWTREDKP